MPGGGRVPMFSGGPPQVSTFDETNQGINPQFRLNSQSEPNPNLSSGQNQYRPQAQLTEQINNAQGPPNNQQDPMNNFQHKYTQPMPSSYPPNHYPSARPSMGQQYPSPYYANSNIYEAPAPVNTPGFPGQSFLSTGMGDFLQPSQVINSLMQTNPMDLVQKPVGMAFNAVEKLGHYGGNVKDGITRVFRDVIGKILDQGQMGTQKLFDMGSAGKNAAFDFSRRLLIPNSNNQQTGNFDGRYSSPQASMSPGYNFNPNQQPPTQMGYVQPQAGAGGQFMVGNSNGQPPPQGAVPQYQQQRPGLNYGTNIPINT